MKEFEMFKAREENASKSFTDEPLGIRSVFDRDRDRILYSKAFRRLSGKTQVFVVGNDDHIRTRLTHTLEVSQIANTISKHLGLSETLTEAIALGHDIGHTPFGHVGERTLNYIMNGCSKIKDFNTNLEDHDKGFKHNWQGLRVILDLEQINKDYFGLNLTDYTMWGILNHSKLSYKYCNRKSEDSICNLLLNRCDCKNAKNQGPIIDFYNRYKNILNEDSWTMEGLVVSIADEIAQRHHDIEDGIEAKIVNVKELICVFKEYFKDYLDEPDNKLINFIQGEKEKIYYLPALSKLIINFLTTRLINDLSINLRKIKDEYKIIHEDDFYNSKALIRDKCGLNNIVCYSPEFKVLEDKFQDYLKNRILNSHKAQSMDGKADYIIRKLFKAYITNPQQLPDKTIVTLYRHLLDWEEFEQLVNQNSTEALTGILRDKLEINHFTQCDDNYKSTLLRVICDYIAGMSDNYAIQQYSLLYGSKRVY